MKPSQINGLLLASFLLFALVYWQMQPGATSPESAASVMPPDHPPLVTTSSNANVTIDALRERVAIAPTDTMLLNHLAQVLHDANRLEEALVYYKRVLEVSPTNSQTWLDLANVYGALEDWENALAASHSLLEIDPDNPSAMYNLGAIHANQANIDGAILWWKRVRDQQKNPALAQQAAQNLERVQPLSTL